MLAPSYPYDPDSSWDASRGLKCSWLQKSLKGLLLPYEFENVIEMDFQEWYDGVLAEKSLNIGNRASRTLELYTKSR